MSHLDPTADKPDDPDHVKQQEVIKDVSPEGRPAHPRFRGKHVALMVLLGVVLLAIVAAVLSIVGQTQIAWGIGLVALLLFIANPVLLASLHRMNERKKAIDEGRPRA
jgi:hypothetical protein